MLEAKNKMMFMMNSYCVTPPFSLIIWLFFLKPAKLYATILMLDYRIIFCLHTIQHARVQVV